MKHLKEQLQNIPAEYKSVPFWSWNSLLDEAELVAQIEDMQAAGMGGFIIHARTGLKEEYLGDHWFACVEACLRKARQLHMRVWIYDENGWPSGFAGGKLLQTEAFRARYLEYETGDFDRTAFANFVSTKDGFRRVNKRVDGAAVYHKIRLCVSPANTDILNPAVVDAFIKETHERYFARFASSFGRELVGFFTDEPQYYRWATPYSPMAAEAFAQRGQDIRDGLIWLFVHDERGYAFRQQYYATLNKLYCETFYKRLYDWCDAHGCMLTGHSVEEGALFAQMYGGAAVMPTYEYEHVPGIDCLGRDNGTELAAKQVGSAAAQLGKRFVLTETYGCAGYDVTPRELKSLAEFQYFNGVTTMCQHLYPYSMAGRGKTDHPPVFSPHGNWGDGFRVFNEYFTRLGYLIANTQEEYDVAVVHPMRDVWLDYIRSEDVDSVKETEQAFGRLLDDLRRNGVTYQLLDETLLQKYGRTQGDTLFLGERAYRCVVVPPMRTMAASTYRLLQAYTGKLWVVRPPQYLDGQKHAVTLPSNDSLQAILARRKVRFRCADGHSMVTARRGDLGEFLFLINRSRTQPSEVQWEQTGYAALDLETLDTRAVGQTIALDPGQSLILIRTQAPPGRRCASWM